MKRIQYGIAGAALVLSLVSCTSAPEQRQGDVLMIAEQGFFASGGTVTDRCLEHTILRQTGLTRNGLAIRRTWITQIRFIRFPQAAAVRRWCFCTDMDSRVPVGFLHLTDGNRGRRGFCGRGTRSFLLTSRAAVLPVQQCA